MVFRRIMILFAVCAVGFLSSDHAQQAAGLAKITQFNGVVMVKNRGMWRQVKQAPGVLYSSDKVVTRQGKAEITLPGGRIFTGVDTNLTLIEQLPAGVLPGQQQQSTLQLNVLVGQLWFELTSITSSIVVRTPSLKQSIDSGEVHFNVGADGVTRYALGTDDTSVQNEEVTGEVQPGDRSEEGELHDQRGSLFDLPGSNPDIDNSEAQRSSARATETQMQVFEAVRKMREQRLQQSKIDNALAEGSGQPRQFTAKQKAVQKGKQAVATSEIAMALAEAKVAAMEQSVAEAARFKEAGTVQAVRQARRMTQDHLVEMKGVKSKIKVILLSELSAAPNDDWVAVKSSKLKIGANTLVANASAAHAVGFLGMAIVNQDKSAISQIDRSVRQAREAAHATGQLFIAAQRFDSALSSKKKGFELVNGKVAAMTLTTISNAAVVLASCAQHLARMAGNALAHITGSGGGRSSAMCQYAPEAVKLSNSVVPFAKKGFAPKVQTNWIRTERMLGNIIQPEELENILPPEKATDFDLAMSVNAPDVGPLTDPLDLATASPSK